MSLFKTRDLWTASCDNDLFDLGCLKVANISANKKTNNSIITGSYNGFLRIYNPTVNINSNNGSVDSDVGFKAHDLICEISFPGPILQIETGKFVSTSRKDHIAVLLTKKLAIYEVIAFEEGNVQHGHQYSLKLVYEHVLQRNAYNMCKGAFGGSIGSSNNTELHEYICVQSMDGMLSVFEYESFSLSCFLPKVLIPGPFKYVPKTDSFITVSSSWELESYKYQNLATSAKTFERKTDAANQKLKRLLPEYTFNLGEAALDIEVVLHSTNTNPNGCSILVLGERNLYCFTETCVLKYMKKFEYNPSSFCAYPIYKPNGTVIGSNSINYLISTHSKLLFVHEDVKVKWAAQLDHVPVQMVVTKIDETQGVIVSLSEDGRLRCCYLGTEPAFMNPIVKEDGARPFNYEAAESEYKSLQGQIKNAIMNTGAVITNMAKSGLIINVDIPTKLDTLTPQNRNRDSELKDPIDSIPSLTCKISLKSVETVNNVILTINCNLPLVAIPDSVSFASIGSIAYDTEVCFYAKTKHIPSNLNVTVCASYSYSANGAPRVAETKFRLPLKLLMKAGQQVAGKQDSQDPKDLKLSSNLKKVTIETNRPCVNLTELFPEFSGSYIASNGNAISAQYYGHANLNVSIQGAKSGANRYRIVSETYDSMWLILQEFVLRLRAYFSKQSTDVDLIYQESLPTDEFRTFIDQHLELRKSIDKCKEQLEQSCVQFRSIQKRLLIKFKDKSPTSLENMDALLEATYRQITNYADNYLNIQKELSIVSNSLNCMASLYVLLISLAFKFSKESNLILEAVMTTPITDTPELGWEEIVNASVSNLLKTVLSKHSKDTNTTQQSSVLKIPEDSSKLEKQIKSFISKLENGASLLPSYRKDNVESESYIVPTQKPSQPEPPKSQANLAPVKKPPVVKTRHTMGEDYDDGQEPEQVRERKPFGSNKLPTFEELMQSEEMKKKNLDNFEFDDD